MVVQRALRGARMRVLLWRCFVVRRKLRAVFKSMKRYFVIRYFSFLSFKFCLTVEKDGMSEQSGSVLAWYIC